MHDVLIRSDLRMSQNNYIAVILLEIFTNPNLTFIQ